MKREYARKPVMFRARKSKFNPATLRLQKLRKICYIYMKSPIIYTLLMQLMARKMDIICVTCTDIKQSNFYH